MRHWHLWGAVVLTPALALAGPFGSEAYRPRPIEARVPWYTVKADLSNISNRQQLPALTPEQKAMLAQVAFVARPTRDEQLFYLYEHNNYKRIPSIVTTDSVLHTYHIFYDFSLRWLERQRLHPLAIDLCRAMLKRTLTDLVGSPGEAVQAALTRNAAYFAVPLELLGQKADLPPAARQLADVELGRIKARQGRAKCLTGATLDYTQFIPRGHYTRSPEQEQYFQALMWYGLVPFDFVSDDALLSALIVCRQLATDDGARGLWRKIYEPTAFYVGQADDLSYAEILPLLSAVFGPGNLTALADPARLAEFRRRAETELRGPGIATEMLVDGQEQTQGQQFRFMGQRFIPDSRILQELCYPKVGTREKPRHFPQGLDVFAVLGSQRAAQLLDVVYRQPEYANYLAQREKLRREFAGWTAADWQANLYTGWLYVLQPLLQPRPEGFPAFMRNLAWRDKSLLTCLASWTQLRHDTILYGKQSVAEAGGDEPAPPPGYVEPEVEVYERLAWLLRFTRAGLRQRGFLTDEDDLAGGFDQFIDLCDELATIARKQLRGTPLSEAELYRIEWYGSSLEALMISAALAADPEKAPARWWSIENKTDRHMAVVADVHTSFDQVLTEAVGHPAELWVVAPFKNRLVAFRGAMFSHYEFVWPAADRLTDEKWQALLAAGKEPPLADWAAKIIRAPGLTEPTIEYDPGPD